MDETYQNHYIKKPLTLQAKWNKIVVGKEIWKK